MTCAAEKTFAVSFLGTVAPLVPVLSVATLPSPKETRASDGLVTAKMISPACVIGPPDKEKPAEDDAAATLLTVQSGIYGRAVHAVDPSPIF